MGMLAASIKKIMVAAFFSKMFSYLCINLT